MKKLKWMAMAFAAAVTMAAFTSCDDDDHDGDDDARELYGVWADYAEYQTAVNSPSSATDVFAVKLTSDGLGYDGHWDMATKSFSTTEDAWFWSADDDWLYMEVDGETQRVRYDVDDDVPGRITARIGNDFYIKVK